MKIKSLCEWDSNPLSFILYVIATHYRNGVTAEPNRRHDDMFRHPLKDGEITLVCYAPGKKRQIKDFFL